MEIYFCFRRTADRSIFLRNRRAVSFNWRAAPQYGRAFVKKKKRERERRNIRIPDSRAREWRGCGCRYICKTEIFITADINVTVVMQLVLSPRVIYINGKQYALKKSLRAERDFLVSSVASPPPPPSSSPRPPREIRLVFFRENARNVRGSVEQLICSKFNRNKRKRSQRCSILGDTLAWYSPLR